MHLGLFSVPHSSAPDANSALLHCAVLLLEGVLVSVVSYRVRRIFRRSQRSEVWHRQLVETASEGIWVVNTDYSVKYANPRVAELLGYSLEEIVHQGAERFFFPEDLPYEKIRLRSVLSSSAKKEQFDRRLRRKDGSAIWVLACSNPIYEETGELSGFLGVMTDITERKGAELALRRSEEKFRGLFENVLQGVYQTTPDGRIVAANPMLLKMLGLSSEAEIHEVDVAKDFYVDSAVRTRNLERLESEGSFQNVEMELRRRDGTIITVFENARTVRDEQGEVLYYEGTLTDITERKRLEAQAQQAHQFAAMNNLAAGIATEFNNILTVVSGHAELALSELPPSHSARAHAEQVRSGLVRASLLTRQLLAFSSATSATPFLIDLNRAVAEAEPSVRRVLGDETGLVLSPGDGDMPVVVDLEHLRQILVQLAISARAPFPNGSAIEITTRVETFDAMFCRQHPGAVPGAFVCLTVRPTDATILAALGEKSGNPIRAAGFAGLGLEAIRAIAGNYGGFILVNRVPGTGSNFSAYFPKAAGNVLPAVAIQPQARILFVDDDPTVLETGRVLLEIEGYSVVTASGAEEAEFLSERFGAFDLLVTDLLMPDVGGAELASRLRNSRPELKVLFVSGYQNALVHGNGTSPANSSFLGKPFSRADLSGKVRSLLEAS